MTLMLHDLCSVVKLVKVKYWAPGAEALSVKKPEQI